MTATEGVPEGKLKMDDTVEIGGKKLPIASELSSLGYKAFTIAKTTDESPMRGTLSLPGKAYTIRLQPNSFVRLLPDEGNLIRADKSDDKIMFVLPSNNASEVFMSGVDLGSHTVYMLKRNSDNAVISGALYDTNDAESMPKPTYVTPEGKEVEVKQVESLQLRSTGTNDLPYVYSAISQPYVKPSIENIVKDIENRILELTPEHIERVQKALDSAKEKTPDKNSAKEVEDGSHVTPSTLPNNPALKEKAPRKP